MSKAIKVWSTEMTARLSTAYAKAEQDNSQLASIAKDLGKTVAMVRSKLVSEGEYIANVKRAVGNASSTRKMDLVRAVETLASLKVGSLDSLEKGSKADLQKLTEALTSWSDRVNAEQELENAKHTAEI